MGRNFCIGHLGSTRLGNTGPQKVCSWGGELHIEARPEKLSCPHCQENHKTLMISYKYGFPRCRWSGCSKDHAQSAMLLMPHRMTSQSWGRSQTGQTPFIAHCLKNTFFRMNRSFLGYTWMCEQTDLHEVLVKLTKKIKTC